MIITGYKLFRLRKNGTLGPLFIDPKLVVRPYVWLKAKAVRTEGFAFRPGWHACSKKLAPHLSKRGRVWCKVSLAGVTEHYRPTSQGGLWYTARWLKIEKILG
jgi:hypothetical protein